MAITTRRVGRHRPEPATAITWVNRHQAACSVGATVLGMALVAGGAGIGIRYAVKTGLTATSVLGIAALVVGLCLLSGATVLAWRALHRWWRLALPPAGVVVLAVIWAIGLGVAYSYSPRSALGVGTPATAGLTYRDVSFATTDGVELSAWYIPSTNRAVVVLLHGSGSNRAATLDQATVLAGHGFGALLVDARGQGRSGGRAMDRGWYGDLDTAAAVAFLQRQPDVDPDRIGLLGLSMGGEEAIGAAAALPGVRAVVAEGATSRTAGDKAGWLPGGVSGFLQRGLDRITDGTVSLLTGKPAPTSLHAAIGRATATRFLLITAGDEPDEAAAARDFSTAAPDRVQVWTVPGSAHTRGLKTQPQQWTTRVIGFLDDALGVSAG